MGLLSGGVGVGSGIYLPTIVDQLDPDVAAFKAVLDSAAESYLPAEITLLDTLVKALKSAAVWSKIRMLWMPVGASLAPAARAIKHPSGTGYKMTATGFAASDWDRRIGLDGRAATNTKFVGTNVRVNSLPSSLSTHLMVASETAGVVGDYRDIGQVDANRFQLIIGFREQGYYGSFSLTNVRNVAVPSTKGIFIGTRLNMASSYWRNGAKLYGRNDDNEPSESGADSEIVIFRAFNFYANKILSAASVGVGLTDAEAIALSNAVQAARDARAAL